MSNKSIKITLKNVWDQADKKGTYRKHDVTVELKGTWDSSKDGKSAIFKMTGFYVTISGPTGSSIPLSLSASVGGQSLLSWNINFPTGKDRKNEPKNLSKTFAKAESDQNVVLQLTVTHDGNPHYKTLTMKNSQLAGSLLKPSKGMTPTGLSIKREGNKFVGSWKVPSAATNSSALNKFTGQTARWTLVAKDVPNQEFVLYNQASIWNPIEVVKVGGTEKVQDNDRGLAANATSNNQAYGEFKCIWGPGKNGALKRGDFFPHTGVTISKVQLKVQGYHKRSGGSDIYYGSWSSTQTYSFTKPTKPTVSWSLDAATKKATVTITSDEGKGTNEWARTIYTVTIKKLDGKTEQLASSSTNAKSFTRTFDLTGYLNGVGPGKYVTVTCVATAQGIAGNSANGSASLNVGMPGIPQITGVKQNGKDEPTSLIAVSCKYDSNLDVTLQLQRRLGESGSWTDVAGATDNSKKLTTLNDVYGALWPNGHTRGVMPYYRLKATRDGYEVYSAEFKAEKLYLEPMTPKCNCTVSFPRDTEAGATTATVYVKTEDGEIKTDSSWSGEGATCHNGTELSYSKNQNAWDYAGGPTVVEMSYTDKTRTAQFNLTGLEEGVRYYVKARRFRSVNGVKYYSGYADAKGGGFVTRSARGVTSKIQLFESPKGGTSVDITVTYNGGGIETTGTELSYSTNPGAWDGGAPPTVPEVYPGSGVTGDHKVTLTGLTPGLRYYIKARRVLTVTEGGTTSTTYGQYSEKQTYKATDTMNAPCDIMAHSPEVTGKGAMIVVGHNDDDKTGTVVEWSDDEHAWKATKQPSTFEMFWKDDDTPYNSSIWAKSQTVYLRDLEIGKTYFVCARRYDDSTGTRLYGLPCDPQPFNTIAGTAWDDTCHISSVTPDEDGRGATVVVAWNENNSNTGTELSWSTNFDAWESNEGPTTMQATWKDDTSKVQNYGGSQTVHIRGLEPGSTYRIRARRYEDQANTFSDYNANDKTFVTPTAEFSKTVQCGIVSIEGVGADSARVIVGWAGDRKGCEVTWSDDPNAWQSTEGPQKCEFEWADPVNASARKTSDTAIDTSKSYYTRSGSGTVASPYVYTKVATPVVGSLSTYYEFVWGATGTLYLNGLKEGTTYYVKARAYNDGDSDKVWSESSAVEEVTPITAPSSVALTSPASIARGDNIELYWSVEHDLEQTEWHVHISGSTGYFKTTDTEVVSGKTYYTRTGSGTLDSPYVYTEVGSPTAEGLANYYELVQGGVELESGTGSLCHATIGPERYGDATSVTLYVRAGCGGATTDSNEVSIGIADAPSCECSCDGTATEQPISAWAYTDDPQALLAVTCRSLGVTSEQPDGDASQLAGDTVWTSALAPAWSLTTWSETQLRSQLSDAVDGASDAYDAAIEAATFALTEDEAVQENKTYYSLSDEVYTRVAPTAGADPSDEGWYEVPDDEEALACDNAYTTYLDAQADLTAHPSDGQVYAAEVGIPVDGSILDGGSYSVTMQAMENTAGLTSLADTCIFGVEWSHQAPAPSAAIEVAVDEAARSASLELHEPDGWDDGDVYEVYRMTPLGHELIAGDVPAGATVTDPYAPFGDAHYRVACRTVDGDVAFEDYRYSLPVKSLRFDWPGGFVELPYNVRLSDAYEKSFEARNHVDGSVNGYYDRAVKRTGSYQVDVNKADEETIASLRALGNHPGAMFCRRADGEAFQCNADLGGVDVTYASMAAGVTFPVTAVRLTRQYMATVEEAE